MTPEDATTRPNVRVLKEGRFIRLVQHDHWEYVQRKNCTGIVIILAMVEGGKVLLTEQHRIPVGKPVIEFPAGLVNDLNLKKPETILAAARRELLEETGYRARRMRKIIEGPAAGGSSSDVITFVLAEGLTRVGEGGGDHTEDITVYEIPIDGVEVWVQRRLKKGILVDPKIYAGLYFLKKYNGGDSF